MDLQALIKICYALDGNYNSDNPKKNGDNAEKGQDALDWEVILQMAGLVHTRKLKNKKSKQCEVQALRK